MTSEMKKDTRPCCSSISYSEPGGAFIPFWSSLCTTILSLCSDWLHIVMKWCLIRGKIWLRGVRRLLLLELMGLHAVVGSLGRMWRWRSRINMWGGNLAAEEHESHVGYGEAAEYKAE